MQDDSETDGSLNSLLMSVIEIKLPLFGKFPPVGRSDAVGDAVGDVVADNLVQSSHPQGSPPQRLLPKKSKN